ncbi:potassium channel family protein [Candidatus Micrarchaeota archaeon]|nr:potassium channel family protein [Candidatus Micrarchaeota archaeon]
MPTMDPVAKSLLNGVALVLLLYIISVPFFIYVEGLTPIESVYFVTVSITSAGYGDIVPKTDIGRMYTVALLLAGVSIFFYHVTHIGQFKEKTIDPHIQRRLQVLRNLTALQTGDVESSQLKRIKEKIYLEKGTGKDREKGDDRSHGFGRL